MTLKRFIQVLMEARNVDLATIASLLNTQPSLLVAVLDKRLRPIPPVWVDRLIEAFALNEEEQRVLRAAYTAANTEAKATITRNFVDDERANPRRVGSVANRKEPPGNSD